MPPSGSGGPVSSSSSPFVGITYTSTPSFLDTPLCSHFITSLSTLFPLRNVPHKPAGPMRSIPTLETRLIPLADELLKAKHKPETRHLVQENLLSRPFINIFIVATSDSDLYRTQIRNEIRQWLNTLRDTPSLHPVTKGTVSAEEGNSSNTSTSSTSTSTSSSTTATTATTAEEDGLPEYLIVYITPPSGTATTPGYFNQASSSSSSASSTSPAGTPAFASTPTNDELVSTPRSGMSKFLASSKSSSSKDLTGGVLDKLKTDFGSGRRSDRILHVSRLTPPPSSSFATGSNNRSSLHPSSLHNVDPTIFTDLVSALKMSLAHTFEVAVKSSQDESAKLKSLRNVRGWNPANLFGKLECLGNSYESVGLYEEALSCFDELETLYKECLRDGQLTFFPSITPTSLSQGQEKSSSILNTSSKPYREMILHSGASLWDLRVYLLARRLTLLSKMARGIAILRVVMAWLGDMTMMVAGEDLPPYCLSSFIFSACFDVLNHCTSVFLSTSGTLAANVNMDKSLEAVLSIRTQDLDRLPLGFHSISCDMIQLAFSHLEKIGMGFEYLPHHQSFTFEQEDDDNAVKTRETTGIANATLLHALSEEVQFDKVYLDIARRLLDAQSRSGRHRSEKILLSKLACLNMHRGKTQEAHHAFSALLESHAEHNSRWTDMEAFLLRRQLECHARLDKPKNRAWVASMVSLLRCNNESSQLVDKAVPEWSFESELFSKLHAASWEFEREVPVSGFAKLSLVAASKRAHILGDQDGVSLQVYVFSSLRHPLKLDDVRFCLIGVGGGHQRGQQYWLTSGPVTINPGRTEIELRSYSSLPGKYILDVSQIRFGKIVFQTIAPKPIPGASQSSALASSASTVVQIPQDGHALRARIEQPKIIALDQNRCGEMIIESGRNKIESAVVRLQHPDSRPLMGFAAAEIASAGENVPSLESTSDGLSIRVQEIPPHYTLRLRFPLDEAPPSDGSAMPLVIEMDYYTAGTKRTLRTTSDLVMALPLGVNVQDFFRLESLFCKFSISTGGGGALKIQDAVLKHADRSLSEERKSDKEYTSQFEGSNTIVRCPPKVKAGTVITPRQPAAFVFHLQQQQQKKSTSDTSASALRLYLTYRTLHEDAMAKMERIARDRLEDTEIPAHIIPLLVRTLSKLVEDHLDVPVFALTGGIRLMSGAPLVRDTRFWRECCRSWDINLNSLIAKVYDLSQDIISQARSLGPQTDTQDESENTWRVLEIPVEVPSMEIVNCVSLNFPEESSLTIGEPVDVQVTIISTTRWSASLPNDNTTSTSTSASSLSPSTSSHLDTPSETASNADTDAFQDAMSDVTATGGRKRPTSTSYEKQVSMAYEIVTDFESWLVSGLKRGTFLLPLHHATTEHKHVVKITLIPVQQGSITLPSISVWPTRKEGSSETYGQNIATRVRVLPAGRHEGERGETFWIPDSVVA
ncbi:unnamed protein product [Sympodiomycopsis kandeliae]